MTTTAPVTGPCAACDYTCNTRCGCPCGCPDPYAWLSDPDENGVKTKSAVRVDPNGDTPGNARA